MEDSRRRWTVLDDDGVIKGGMWECGGMWWNVVEGKRKCWKISENSEGSRRKVDGRKVKAVGGRDGG